jgi:serine/threonine protein kinase
VVKICDFGFSKKTNSKRLKNSTIVGTPLYMSIEILKGEQYTSKCDIWALGFIFYELLHGTPPWNGASEYQLITHLEGCPLKFHKPLSAATKNFLSMCLAVQEAQRMNWDQLLRHEMFNGMFAHYVAKEHQFENKFKTIMAQLRYEINSNNIDLDRLIEMYGFGRLRDLDFKAFDRLMRAIDPDLTIEEVRFIFEKLDQDDSNTVSLVEFQAALVQNNIPLKSHYGMPPKKESSKEKDPDD